jgi:hypothetical protein
MIKGSGEKEASHLSIDVNVPAVRGQKSDNRSQTTEVR